MVQIGNNFQRTFTLAQLASECKVLQAIQTLVAIQSFTQKRYYMEMHISLTYA